MLNLFIKKRQESMQNPPGSLHFLGEKKQEKTIITLIDYNPKSCSRRTLDTIDDLPSTDNKGQVTWINIDGLDDTAIMNQVQEKFMVHPLIMEDIINTTSRPKVEMLDNQLLVILRMFSLTADGLIDSEQVSLLLGRNYLISFQEKEGDVFDPVRDRMESGRGKIRTMGADYLLYSLLDIIIDNYYIILDKFATLMDPIEEEIILDPALEHSRTIHNLKKELLYLRKAVWPLREVINTLLRDGGGIINKGTIIFLRDIYDQIIQIMDHVETFRDTLTGLMETYISSISNRMNSIMKVLTLIATIFIPLTFIAGVYGMNFKYMPGLGWKGGYFLALGFMALVSLVMVLYFKFKKWF